MAPSSARAATAADGQKAFIAGRYADALAIWLPLAAQGDPRAKLGMGVLYDVGDGVAQNSATALRYYRQAAEAGLPDAELNVAVMCDSGRGTTRDAKQAAAWYARAAAHHDHRAEYDLAQLYDTGDGVPQNPVAAQAWLQAAAAGGLEAAGERLAQHRALRDQPERAGFVPATLASVTPQAPQDGITLPRDSVTRDAELVWIAPPEPGPAQFFVQVLAVTPSGPITVVDSYTDTTSILVPLTPAHSQYVWRVYVVSATLRSYLPSGWSRFNVIWRGSLGSG